LSRLWSKLRPKQAYRSLSEAERRGLIEAQVKATRPIISGVLLSGALILGVTGIFEAIGAAPGIGYPWWVNELVSAAIGGCALAVWHIENWRPRLALVLLGTVLFGVFLSIPTPGESGQLAIRTGLFQLLPIALLALLARPFAVACLVVVMLGIAYVRIAMHGSPNTGAALYWLYTATTVAFGLLMGRFLRDYAVSAFRLRQRMRKQTITDELTGLLNRAGWNRDAAEAYAVATRRGLPISFAFLDIDFFKAVNDTYGHETGDSVLQMLGRILAERAAPDSFVARLGGEEFVVMFIDQTPDQVEGFVMRVRSEFEHAADEYSTRVSAGVAHRQPGETMSGQLRRADIALYEAKAAGRDQMVVSRA
jgi:diguanylate cyclase (GGDEF)-like protein